MIDRNVDKRGPEVRAAAEAFVRYLFTPVAQREFAACGFRSVDKSVAADTTLPKARWWLLKTQACLFPCARAPVVQGSHGLRSYAACACLNTCGVQVNKLWRVEDKLGSWNAVQKQFFGDKVRCL